MLRLENIKIYEDLTEEDVVKKACEKYNIDFSKVNNFVIYKKSIDARNKDNIFYNYTIDVNYIGNKKIKGVKIVPEEKYELNIDVKRNSKVRPVIIGAGPAGLFCALILAQKGIKPIIIEQGKKVEDRKRDIDTFLETGKLNTNSNVQFGEGGAGTFSDGKLTTGVNNPLGRIVLKEFVNFGAPKQIMYISKPHIGTDNLIVTIANMREHIISLGGEFLFETKLIDFEVENNLLKKVICKDLNTNEIKEFEADSAVFAIGHSARDTFEKMYEKVFLFHF